MTNFATQIGANSGQSKNMTIGNTSTAALGINTNVTDISAANNAMNSLDSGLQALTSIRTDVGAMTDSLEFAADDVNESSLNLQAAASSMGDADVGQETSLLQQFGLKLYASMMAMGQNMQQQKTTLSLLG